MLVLTREVDERVILTDTKTGEELGWVMVVRIGRDRVKLGFEFPHTVSIDRPHDEQTVGQKGREQ